MNLEKTIEKSKQAGFGAKTSADGGGQQEFHQARLSRLDTAKLASFDFCFLIHQCLAACCEDYLLVFWALTGPENQRRQAQHQ
jgi:hypothetical protein